MLGSLWAVPIYPIDITLLYNKVIPQHLILKSEVEKSLVKDLVGITFFARASQICWNQSIQIILFELPIGIPCEENEREEEEKDQYIILSQTIDRTELVLNITNYNRCKLDLWYKFRIEFIPW